MEKNDVDIIITLRNNKNLFKENKIARPALLDGIDIRWIVSIYYVLYHENSQLEEM